MKIILGINDGEDEMQVVKNLLGSIKLPKTCRSKSEELAALVRAYALIDAGEEDSFSVKESLVQSFVDGNVTYEEDHIHYEVERDDGRKICVITDLSGQYIQSYRVDILGRMYPLKLRDTPYKWSRHAWVSENTTINLAEICYQADRLNRGLNVLLGSYNHKLPIKYRQKLNLAEDLRPEAGEICSIQQNKMIWWLLERIRVETGLICSCPAHTKLFSLAMLDRKIKDEDLMKFNFRIHKKEGYVEFLE